MALETLVAGAVAILTPYVAAGSIKAAETLGENLADNADALWSKVREWLQGDDRAKVVENFASAPALNDTALEQALLARLKGEPSLVGQLEALLDSFGSRVEVRQKIRQLAGEAIGIDVGVVSQRLDAFVGQDVDTVTGTLTGARIEKM